MKKGNLLKTASSSRFLILWCLFSISASGKIFKNEAHILRQKSRIMNQSRGHQDHSVKKWRKYALNRGRRVERRLETRQINSKYLQNTLTQHTPSQNGKIQYSDKIQQILKDQVSQHKPRKLIQISERPDTRNDYQNLQKPKKDRDLATGDEEVQADAPTFETVKPEVEEFVKAYIKEWAKDADFIFGYGKSEEADQDPVDNASEHPSQSNSKKSKPLDRINDAEGSMSFTDIDDPKLPKAMMRIPSTVVLEPGDDEYWKVVINKKFFMEFGVFEEKHREIKKLMVSISLRNDYVTTTVNLQVLANLTDEVKNVAKYYLGSFMRRNDEFVRDIEEIKEDVQKTLEHVFGKPEPKDEQDDTDKDVIGERRLRFRRNHLIAEPGIRIRNDAKHIQANDDFDDIYLDQHEGVWKGVRKPANSKSKNIIKAVRSVTLHTEDDIRELVKSKVTLPDSKISSDDKSKNNIIKKSESASTQESEIDNHTEIPDVVNIQETVRAKKTNNKALLIAKVIHKVSKLKKQNAIQIPNSSNTKLISVTSLQNQLNNTINDNKSSILNHFPLSQLTRTVNTQTLPTKPNRILGTSQENKTASKTQQSKVATEVNESHKSKTPVITSQPVKSNAQKSSKSKSKDKKKKDKEEDSTVKLQDNLEDVLDNESASIKSQNSKNSKKSKDSQAPEVSDSQKSSSDQITNEDVDEDNGPGDCLNIGCEQHKNLFSKEETKGARVILRLITESETVGEQQQVASKSQEIKKDDEVASGQNEQQDTGKKGEASEDSDKQQIMKAMLLPNDMNYNAVHFALRRIRDVWMLRLTHSYFEQVFILKLPTKRMIIKQVTNGLHMLERKLTQIKAFTTIVRGEKERMNLSLRFCEVLFRRVVLREMWQPLAARGENKIEDFIKVEHNPTFPETTIRFFFNNAAKSRNPVLEIVLRVQRMNDGTSVTSVKATLFERQKPVMMLRKEYPVQAMFNVYVSVEDFFTDLVQTVKNLFFLKTEHVPSIFSDPGNLAPESEREFDKIPPIEVNETFENIRREPYTAAPHKTEFVLGPADEFEPKFVHIESNGMVSSFLYPLTFMDKFFSTYEKIKIPSVEYYAIQTPFEAVAEEQKVEDERELRKGFLMFI